MSRLRSNRMKRAPARLNLLVTGLRSTDRLEICARVYCQDRLISRSIGFLCETFVSISFQCVQIWKRIIGNRVREKIEIRKMKNDGK